MIENFILGIIAHFINIPLAIAIAGFVVICLGVLIFTGHTGLWQFLKDWKTWIAIAVVAIAVYFWPQAQQQQAVVQSVVKEVAVATNDGKAVVTEVNTKRKKRQAQTGQMQDVINHAKTGDAVDSLMDEIAREQDSSSDDAPTGTGSSN